MRFAIVLALLALSGCQSKKLMDKFGPDKETRTPTFLFEQDGCKVYRFLDRGAYHLVKCADGSVAITH